MLTFNVKLRLFVLQVPLPKVPPIILAGIGISNLDAPSLFVYLKQIIDGLIAHGIQVRSYACDGTAVERSLQVLLDESATRTVIHAIKHPADTNGIKINVHYHGEKGDTPIVNMQDGKHGRKTGRNNLMSGGHVLTFPNHVALYAHLKQLVDEGGPLFRRDVEKIDRQDGRAASRLTSGPTLDWFCENHPEHLGNHHLSLQCWRAYRRIPE